MVVCGVNSAKASAADAMLAVEPNSVITSPELIYLGKRTQPCIVRLHSSSKRSGQADVNPSIIVYFLSPLHNNKVDCDRRRNVIVRAILTVI